jgi:two-component system chemotaxis response regulator CheB
MERSPNAIVLDFDLPILSGRHLVARLAARTAASVFLLAPKRNRESTRLAMALHRLGVVAVYPKPEVPKEWSDLGRTLRETLHDLGMRETPATRRPVPSQDTRASIGRLRHVAVGGSTGGPGAVFELLSALGHRPRFGVAVVQHIAKGFEGALTEWLTAELGLDVGVARHGEHLVAGTVRIAPSGEHLSLDPSGVLRLDGMTAPLNGHRPAVDLLFRSLLALPADRVAAILLSGMGSDGAAAMAELRGAGVLTIAQDEASCAVFGMPRAAIEAGAAAFTLAPKRIGHLLAKGKTSGRE